MLEAVQFGQTEETIMDEQKGLSYFFLGLGVGVALGIVFAPKSGEETRALIKGKVDESSDLLRRRSEELSAQAREAAAGYVERGRTVVTRQREQLNAAVEAGRAAYREATQAASAGAEPTQS